METPRLSEGATVYPTKGKTLIILGKAEGEETLVDIGEASKIADGFTMEAEPGESLEDLTERMKARIQIWLDEEPRSKPERDCD